MAQHYDTLRQGPQQRPDVIGTNIISAGAAVSFGLAIAGPGNVLSSLYPGLGILQDLALQGFAISVAILGAFLSSVILGILELRGFRYSRRWVILGAAALYVGSSAFLPFIHTFWLFALLRLCAGFALGPWTALPPPYTLANLPSRAANAANGRQQTFINIGIAAAIALGLILRQWQITLVACALPSLVYLLIGAFVGKEQHIQRGAAEEIRVTWWEAFISVVFGAATQAPVANGVPVFAATIITFAGNRAFAATGAFLVTILAVVASLFAAIPWSMPGIRPKKMMVSGLISIGAVLAGLSAVVYLHIPWWSAFLLLLAWEPCYQIFIGPAYYTLLSHQLQPSARNFGGFLGSATQWLIAGLTLQFFPVAFSSLPPSPFIAGAIFTWICALFIAIVAKEVTN